MQQYLIWRKIQCEWTDCNAVFWELEPLLEHLQSGLLTFDNCLMDILTYLPLQKIEHIETSSDSSVKVKYVCEWREILEFLRILHDLC